MVENPSINGSDAVRSPHDARDILYTDVAYGSAPFDWSVGYDGEEDLSAVLGSVIKIPIKDQNGSGSCGGQAEAYGGAMVSAFNDKVFEEKSAKFAYAPVAIIPSGGSSGRALSDRAINVGWGSEALTPSYENGKPPSEAFMERMADITPEAITHANKDHALSYTLLPIDIDVIAQAIRDFKFVRMGIVGSNNGTWLSADPKPPTDAEAHWWHWMAGLKAKMRNGKKAIGLPNSWGLIVGAEEEKGWQWLNEDWFKAQLTNDPNGGNMAIFEPRCYTWNPVPIPQGFKHSFEKDLYFGLIDHENQFLQTALRIDGEFPDGIPYNDRFGNVTLTAVQKFQVKYGISNPLSAGYGRCGPLTRAKLTSLFGGV